MNQPSKKEQVETITKLLGETLQKMGYKLFITSFCVADADGVIAGTNICFPNDNPFLLKAMFADMCKSTLLTMDTATGEQPLNLDNFKQY